jgi:hypothetical protein
MKVIERMNNDNASGSGQDVNPAKAIQAMRVDFHRVLFLKFIATIEIDDVCLKCWDLAFIWRDWK